MADEKGYTYVVLARIPTPGEQAIEGTYASLGAHRGRTPEEAIKAAVDEYGLPKGQDGGEVAAIPASKWHAREVKSRTEKVHEIIATNSPPFAGVFPPDPEPEE